MIGAGLPEACQHLTHVHGHVDVYLHENAPAMAATAANASERLAPFDVTGAQERMLLDQYRFSRLQHILAPRVGDHGRGMRDDTLPLSRPDCPLFRSDPAAQLMQDPRGPRLAHRPHPARDIGEIARRQPFEPHQAITGFVMSSDGGGSITTTRKNIERARISRLDGGEINFEVECDPLFSVGWNAPSEVVHPLGYAYPVFRRTTGWLASERSPKTSC